jgi:lipopolysaccharide export system permease protein
MYREGEWSIIGTWFSVMVLTPLSVFFTVKANGDSTLFQWDVVLEFFRYWFGTKVKRNIVRKEVVINDPDRAKCLATLSDVKRMSVELENSALLNTVPSYRDLFFGSVDSSRMTALSDELEQLVTELGNSRDRVELDYLNGFPLLQSHGVQPPFEKAWADKFVGVVFPLGLLFELRAWLFTRKLKRQMQKISQTADSLIDYMTNNKQTR